MQAAIAMWGNSLALRLPRRLAADVNIEVGTPVDLSVHQGSLVVTPARKRYRLDDLLARVEKKESEVDFGAPVGEEI